MSDSTTDEMIQPKEVPTFINGASFIDDRGVVTFTNDMKFDNIKRWYLVSNHDRNYVRAWHGHKNEEKYVFVIKGTFLVGTVDLETEKVTKYVLSEKAAKVLHIPKNYANGFMNLTDDNQILFLSTSTLEESTNDDIRFKWDKWNIWTPEYR